MEADSLILVTVFISLPFFCMFEMIDHHFNVTHHRCQCDFISTFAFMHGHMCCRQKFPKVDK